MGRESVRDIVVGGKGVGNVFRVGEDAVGHHSGQRLSPAHIPIFSLTP